MLLNDPQLSLFFAVLVFVTGACIGSFLNVVIYRVPAGVSVVTPRSRCKCGHWIAWYDNIPILSWFILRGKCRACGDSFSFRYPMVELLTGLLFLGLWDAGQPLDSLVWFVFAGILVAVSFIDLDTMEIPDRFSIGGFLLGICISFLVPSIHGQVGSMIWMLDSIRGGSESLIGAFAGSGLILWFALVSEVALRKETMGFGDVKLMGAIGAFCGWQGAVFSLFGGAVIGLVGYLVCLPFLRKNATGAGSGENWETDPTGSGSPRIPFGPALAAGALVYILWLAPAVDAYFSNLWEVMSGV